MENLIHAYLAHMVFSLTEMEMAYRRIAGLGDRLADIREENSRHSQVSIYSLSNDYQDAAKILY